MNKLEEFKNQVITELKLVMNVSSSHKNVSIDRARAITLVNTLKEIEKFEKKIEKIWRIK